MLPHTRKTKFQSTVQIHKYNVTHKAINKGGAAQERPSTMWQQQKDQDSAPHGRVVLLWGLGSGVEGLGSEVWGLRSGVWDLRSEVWDLRSGVWGRLALCSNYLS